MKKTVKSLIIAASVAAVAGIGAVSFAAWSGSTKQDLVGDNLATGTVVAVGFDETATAFENTTKALMPIDQASITEASQTYYYKATLKTVGTDFTGYKITMKTEALSGSAVPTGLKYALDPAAAPTGGSTGTTDISSWSAASGTIDLVTTGIANESTYTVYIALSSDNDDYNDNAGKQFKITFELVAPTA